MRKLVLPITLLALAAATFTEPKPKATLLFTLKGHETRDPAVSRDGRRVYYLQDSTDLYMFDRTTGRSTHVLGNMLGAGANVAVSPANDRLAFSRYAEDGHAAQLWTVTLEPATGLPNGAPRRVSILRASAPVFSPDGRSIAFATPTSAGAQSIAVVPVNGGPERIVAETRGEIWPLQWVKTDTLYFGLSFGSKADFAKNGMYRVAVSGGTPQFIARTADWGQWPGSTPDGRFIVSYDSTWDSVLVLNASGKRLHAYKPSDREVTADVWFGNARAIGWKGHWISAVRAIDLATGKERVLSDTSAHLEPSWSPDGRQVAFIQVAPTALVIMNVDGSGRRKAAAARIPMPNTPLLWSPDGRSIFYRNNLTDGGIDIVDVATLRTRQIARMATAEPLPRWRADSKAILYGVVNGPENSDSLKKIEIREALLDGADRLLHSIQARCNGGAHCGKIVDDSLLATWSGATGDYAMTNFRTRAAPRIVYQRDATQQQPVPTFSNNGRWMVVRRQSKTDRRWSIEVMHPDGLARHSAQLAFGPAPGLMNAWVSDDGSQVVIVSHDCPASNELRCSSDENAIYRVDIASGKSTPVAVVPRVQRPVAGPWVSPDSRTLVYTRDIEARVEFYEVDYSEVFKGR